MNDSGSRRPCFWNEFQIREFLPLAAKWSPLLEPFVAAALEEMIVEKAELMRLNKLLSGKSAFNTRTPGPERRT
jgi:hypothetical protein